MQEEKIPIDLENEIDLLEENAFWFGSNDLIQAVGRVKKFIHESKTRIDPWNHFAIGCTCGYIIGAVLVYFLVKIY